MEGGNKHIDEFFKQELDNHREPLGADDWSLFEASRKTRRRFISPKYVKWLPYLAGLSAAAAIGYFGKPLFIHTPPPPQETIATPKATGRYKPQTLHIEKDTTLTAIAIQPSQLPSTGMHVPVMALQPYIPQEPVREPFSALEWARPLQFRYMKTSAGYNYIYASASLTEKSVPYKSIITTEEQTAASASEGLSPMRIDMALKLGFETNMSYMDMSMGVFSIQLRCKVTDRLYVGMMPGIKAGRTSSPVLPASQTKYGVPFQSITPVENKEFPGTYNYYSTQFYDSISVHYSVKNTVWELELPVFAEFKLTKKISVMAGLKFMYGKPPQIVANEHAYHINYTDSVIAYPVQLEPNESSVFFENHCNCVPDDASAYQNPSYTPLRTAYMLGVKYSPGNRLFMDLTLHQNSSDLSHIPNADIRRMYNTPQVRFSIGYNLGARPKRTVAAE